MIEPHWFFFSGMGFFALFAGGLQKMINKNAFIGRTLTACVIILFIVFSWDYNARWKSQESYSRFWLFLNKGDWTPYYGLGRALMDKGDYAGAAGWFLDGLTRCGMVTVEYASDLGHVLDRLGHDDDALRYLNTAIRIDKNYSLTYHYLGLYLAKRGHHAEAQENFRMSVALDPGNSPSSAYLERTR
jgi:tetratricopeptide (TPR) repeat protein